jgi:predicted lipoprotein with Yx(FWY)xxD motif
MKKHHVIAAALLAAVAALTACAGSEAAKTATPATAPPAAPVATTVAAAPAAGTTVVVKAGSSSFGQILVDSSGNTLYAFTNDTAAQSTCSGTCAEAWPPVVVDPSWTVAPGLDAGVFSTVIRTDGTEQLMAGKFPLYRFSGDARPGDVNGQGSGGVWFVVDTAANIIEGGDPVAAPTEATTAPVVEEAPLVGVADTDLGQLLADASGRTVYGFTKDADGTPTCVDGCANAWPPVIVDDSLDLSTLPDAASFSVVDRPDGSKQLKAGKWPLYYFSGDTAAGEANGQGSGGIWFVVAPDATLIK